MSTIYVSEPATKGKVLLTTSYGPVEIELWPKEAPKAVRNFVQLCLEGYYDGTVFHRVIKPFLVQGGDPTGTGEGGQSIYPAGVFPDEFHSRLRFNHRGLVACANAGRPNSNGSQFFITLDRCEWLDKKHTIFGKVIGDSIYNVLGLGELETGKDDRPTLDPLPQILSVEVLWNPFDDIVPRRLLMHPNFDSSEEKETEQKKKKVTKKLNLLSFGEEAEEDDKELLAVVVKTRITSSRDVLNENHDQGPKTEDVQLIMVKEDEGYKFDAPNKKEWADAHERVIASTVAWRKLLLMKKRIGSEFRAKRMAADIADDAGLHLLGDRQIHKQKKLIRKENADVVLAKLDRFKSTKFQGSD
ncbi:hypothetical protein ACP275_10G002600 [Erythranthe tilingii]